MRVQGVGVAIAIGLCGITAAGAQGPSRPSGQTGPESSLIDAVKSGNGQTVRTLLRQRADVNVREPDGTTPLHWAVQADDLEATQLLIRAGARVDAANRYRVTPLSLAAVNGNPTIIDTLLKAGADPNTVLPEGETVLMTAARSGAVAAVKALLSRGADVNAREAWLGETALMLAAAENHAEVLDALIEAGADLDGRSAPVNLPQLEWGVAGMSTTVFPRGSWTPLMFAAQQGAVNATRVLADRGADLNLVDPDGTTALSFAIINAHYDVAALLLDKAPTPILPIRRG